MMMLVILAALVGGARAACDACVRGRCHARRTLARELRVPDQLAIDRARGVLYVHSDSSSDTAFFLDGLTIQLLRQRNFTGLAVDQETHTLYTTDKTNMFEYTQDKLNTTTQLIGDDDSLKPKGLFYKNVLFFISTSQRGIYYLRNNEYWEKKDLKNYTISDFIMQDSEALTGRVALKTYFVANDMVYFYNDVVSPTVTKIVSKKKHVLSIDKFNDVYFGDATLNVIFKMDNVTNKLVEYAAYESGSVDKFVFDNNNNIVSYDSAAGSISLWQPDPQDDVECTIEAPHSKYLIKKLTDLDDSDCIQ